MSTMTAGQFGFLCELIRSESAIVLEPGKEYLAETRLSPIARREGLGSVAALVEHLLSSPTTPLRAQVVDAMTTNETSFFRDVHPWQTLREEILPDLLRARSNVKRLNILCAACSSGQEPYSLAMLLLNHFPNEVSTWNIRIMATDLSESMVNRCKEGVFSQLEVNRGLPAGDLVRYFTREDLNWRVDERVRRMVEVRQGNLVAPSTMPKTGPLDLVMIRNVLIYFDDNTKTKILTGIREQMNRDGYLLLGSSEVSSGLASGFSRQQNGRTISFRPAV